MLQRGYIVLIIGAVLFISGAVISISHPIALQIRIESNSTTGQAANLREVVKDSNGKVLSLLFQEHTLF